MPCIGKIFESVLNNRLSFKNDVCNDNDPYQASLRSNSRTTDNIFILCAIMDKQTCLSKPLYTCFVDFSKAFDYIDRSALYYKLLSSKMGLVHQRDTKKRILCLARWYA